MFQGFNIKTNSDQTIPNLVNHFGNVHSMMTEVTQRYFEVFRKQTYVTPKSYLSFLQTFKRMYQQKQGELMSGYNRLKSGLDKLEKASKDVDEMSKKLEVEKKELAVSQIEVNAKMGEIEIKKKEAGKIKAEVQKVVDECSEKARVVKEKTDIATEGQKIAEPEKEAAEKALSSMDPSAINELLVLQQATNTLARVFDMVLILMNEKVEKIQFSEVGDKIKLPNITKSEGSWLTHIKPILSKAGFYQRIVTYEKDAVTDE